MIKIQSNRNLYAVNHAHWQAVKNQALFNADDLKLIFGYAHASDAARKGRLPPPSKKGYAGNPNDKNCRSLWTNEVITKEVERREKIHAILDKAIADIQALAIV